MSFSTPLVLLALAAVPLLIGAYIVQQRRRARAAAAFASPPLTLSVAPRAPRWRRHAPMVVFGVALLALIGAAARPQRSVAVPVDDGAVMLANDASSSMAATDVAPSRLQAALHADRQFLAGVPRTIRVGLLQFARRPTLLQSPTSDHALTASALTAPKLTGGTAMGEAITLATQVLGGIRSQTGKRLPSAIVLLSDGASNGGLSPITAARVAAAQHIPVYTVSVGTASGTIETRRGSRTVSVPVPADPTQLAQVAQVSHARAFTAADARRLSQVYAHLAAQLGHRHVKQEITASFAGVGLVLLLVGSAMSLRWFGRLV